MSRQCRRSRLHLPTPRTTLKPLLIAEVERKLIGPMAKPMRRVRAQVIATDRPYGRRKTATVKRDILSSPVPPVAMQHQRIFWFMVIALAYHIVEVLLDLRGVFVADSLPTLCPALLFK